MTTVSMFNHMLATFVDELILTFPEERALRTFKDELQLMTTVSPGAAADMFMAALGPHVDLIMNKNPALFEQDIGLGEHLDLHKIWHAPEITDETRNAIWQHVQTLFLFASTLKFTPPEMLQSVEQAAHHMAANMQQTDSLDVSKLLPDVMGFLSNIMNAPPALEKPKNKEK